MKFNLGVIFGIMLITALVLLIIKYSHTLKTEKKFKREIKFKWLGWYDKSSIDGTSSIWKREYMITINWLNFFMYLSLAGSFTLYLLGKYLLH